MSGTTSRRCEKPLGGHGVSGPTRLGDVVLRPTGPHSFAVHALLRHLERVGFDAAPRFIGVESDGREVLSYVDGLCPEPPVPGYVAGESIVEKIGALIRRYHQAAASFVPPEGAKWQRFVGGHWNGPIVCHNDLYPSNIVFRDHLPVAMIDWDFASPARPVFDLASAALQWVPLKDEVHRLRWGWPENEDESRLRSLCSGYGADRAMRSELLAVVRERLVVAHRTYEEWGLAGRPGFAELWKSGTARRIRGHIDWLDRNRARLQGALDRVD